MPKKRQRQINLLPIDEFEGSTLGRVLKWALSSFRVLVIVTEMIVMGAFLSRFWLDSKNSDLNDEIQYTKSQILAYKDVEDELDRTQKKLSALKSIYSKNKMSSFLNQITISVPQEIVLTSISDTDSQIQIKGISPSELPILSFLSNLKANTKFIDIRVEQISKISESNNLSFFVSAKSN